MHCRDPGKALQIPAAPLVFRTSWQKNVLQLEKIVDLDTHPIGDPSFRAKCSAALEHEGILVLPGFARPATIAEVLREGRENRDKVFAQVAEHTVYLDAQDPAFAADHPRNRLVTSSKGCITDDRVPRDSALRTIYDAALFREFLCHILDEEALFEYADPLSSINLHFAEKGQELGWHFDNSSFSITLMVQPPERGGAFEYVTGLRNAQAGEMGYDAVADVLDGRAKVSSLSAQAGTLVVFHGRNSLHRVAPNESERTRVLAVLAYNSQPGVALSEKARMTFYGRIG